MCVWGGEECCRCVCGWRGGGAGLEGTVRGGLLLYIPDRIVHSYLQQHNV